MKKRIVLTGLIVVLTVSFVQSVTYGPFPGLDELIEEADAIVILKIHKDVADYRRSTPYSTHDCVILQTLKGDIPTNKTIRLDLWDTRSFYSSFARSSRYLMFLRKLQSPQTQTDYRTISRGGSSIRLPLTGHEKMPAGKTTKDQIKSLLKRAIKYNKRQHAREQAFLKRMIKGTAETMDEFDADLRGR